MTAKPATGVVSPTTQQAGDSRHDKQNTQVIDWLLQEDQPSVRYHTMVHLLERKEDDPEVRVAHSKISRIGWARDILRLQKPQGFWEPREPTNVREWMNFLRVPEYVATTWRALVLSDLGLTSRDPRIRKIADRFFEYKLQLGSMINIFTEEVCAVGNTARLLTRFGYGDDHRVRKLYDWMLEDQREDGGWNCSQGTPGTLDGWEALAAFAALPKSKRSGKIEQSISRGAEFYLERRLFREGRKYVPWFRFHYPTHIYYDILVGLDMITRLGFADDPRLEPALKILKEKRRADGTWSIDRVHQDLGPGATIHLSVKKVKPFALEAPGKPSKWITLTALRVLKRVEDAK
jgi:hypothetical protein